VPGSYAASVCLVSGSASAQDDVQRQALNNLQGEMTKCAAYYAIGNECLRLRERPQEDAQLIQVGAAAKDRLSKQAVEIGIAVGITPDAILSRLSNEITSMKALINNSCINMASLLSRHAVRCKRVTEDPDSILVEYMKEEEVREEKKEEEFREENKPVTEDNWSQWLQRTPGSLPTGQPPKINADDAIFDNHEIVTWRRQIVALLERNKRYPESSLSSREQGVAQIFFSIDRQGGVVDSRVEHSSGAAALDEEALALVRRAQPFPKPPSKLVGERVDLVVPIRFYLN
jgi:TonB family protein